MADKKKETETSKPTCNIVMPISTMESYTERHWGEVLSILRDVIESAGFTGDLVSNSDETSVIHKTIVQNVYNSDVVICDISGKNANVMFELGLRLAFDKATIIIKDEITPFSFDTSPIEHLIYPHDLRYATIVDFKEKLKNKIIATYKKSKEDTNYSTFLKHFGEFRVSHLESKEVSSDIYILETLKDVLGELRTLKQQNLPKEPTIHSNRKVTGRYRFTLDKSQATDTVTLEIYDFLTAAGWNIFDIDLVHKGNDVFIDIWTKVMTRRQLQGLINDLAAIKSDIVFVGGPKAMSDGDLQ